MSAGKSIRIGSIIHLENELPNGGYLDARGWVTDKSVISQFQDERIRKFVSTHGSSCRSVGTGSWLVLSANGKSDGKPVVSGDKIHLLNMHPGSGYLDTFEWVDRLIPFQDFPMQIGVFATSTPKRDGGSTGTWTIWSAADKSGKQNDELFEDQSIYLENNFPNAGFLCTYGDMPVTKHPMFEDYTGQQRFVFTTTDKEKPDGSSKWKVGLSNLSGNLYRVQNRWGGEHIPWQEGGLFKIGNASEQPLIALNLTSNDQGKTLSGTAKYQGEPSKEVNLKATHQSQNVYLVEINQRDQTSQWLLGSRKHQKIIALAIESADEGDTLAGKITYAGESPVEIKASRGFTTARDDNKLLDDVLHPEWVSERTNKMEILIVANDKLLADHVVEMRGISTSKDTQPIYQLESKNKQRADEDLKQPDDQATSGQNTKPFELLDPDFQIQQLLNLQTLSHFLNYFSRYTLYELMKRSLRNHRTDEDEPVVPLHLFRRCFERIAADHAIIELATTQRRWNRGLEGNYLRAQAVELLILDKLALKAVVPFQHLLVDPLNITDDLAIITFLSEQTHIHLVPYTKQVILIGVNYDRVPPVAGIFDGKKFIGKNLYAFELMAIPHEVGHYVYQHGKLEGKTFLELSEKFEGNPYYRWCEELFADVYSCIVAGPLAAISMQALLMSIDRDRAWKDDEDHPTPVLRVFIFAEILRILHDIEEMAVDVGEVQPNRYEFSKVTNKLDQNWTEILKLWGYDHLGETSEERRFRPVRVYLHDKSDLRLDKIVNVTRVIKAIRPMIEEFATRLLAVAKFGDNEQPDNEGEKLSTRIPWSRTDQEETGIYNIEMHRIVNLNFAGEQFSYQAPNIQVDEALSDLSRPDERLQHYLKSWSDRGPHGWGNH